MMWDDSGFLLSKNRYSEHSLIAEIYTKDYGKVPGIIFGGTSKKIKNYLQIGNKVYVNYNSKSQNKIGYFKIEILKATSPIYFDNYKKLSCISSAMNLIKLLNAEFQKNLEIFNLIENFFLILESEFWIKNYIFWELELFKILGYDLKLNELAQKRVSGDRIQYFTKSKTIEKMIPRFLIEKNQNNIDKVNLLEGLKLVGDYLDKTILQPNNLNQPTSRIHFINSLK